MLSWLYTHADASVGRCLARTEKQKYISKAQNILIGPYFFQNENVTGGNWQKASPVLCVPKLRDYAEDIIFQQNVAPPRYAVPMGQYLDRTFRNRGMGELVQFYGRFAHLIWLLVTTFYGDIWNILYTVNLLTVFPI